MVQYHEISICMGLDMKKVIFLIVLFVFSTSALAKNLPSICRLDCAEQFRFLQGIDDQTTLSDFRKIFGAPFKVYKSDKKYVLHEFRGTVTHTAVLERSGEILAVGIFKLNKNTHLSGRLQTQSIPIPRSPKTLYDWPFSVAKSCSKLSDIEKFSLGAAAGDYLLSGYCHSSIKAFDYMRFLYSAYETNCSINDEQKVVSCNHDKTRVQALAVILSKKKLIQHSFLGEIGGSQDIKPETWVVECVLNQVNC